jgi:hypothetical protein
MAGPDDSVFGNVQRWLCKIQLVLHERRGAKKKEKSKKGIHVQLLW